MSYDDRQRWNERFTRGDHVSPNPSSLIVSVAEYLPTTGSALDVAGGAGRHALWLAERGLNVTLVDVSDVGLQMARDRAQERSLTIHTVRADLLNEALPAGPWDVILSTHFLHRPIFKQYPKLLARGGILVVLQPTLTNLDRHQRPPADFLLQDGELPTLVNDLTIVHYREGWLEEGRHDALLVARRD